MNSFRGDRLPKYGCFFGKVPKGGGVISDPKNYIADFVGFKAVYFGRKFWKKCPKRGGEGGHRQSKKFHCKFTHTYEFSGKRCDVISNRLDHKFLVGGLREILGAGV